MLSRSILRRVSYDFSPYRAYHKTSSIYPRISLPVGEHDPSDSTCRSAWFTHQLNLIDAAAPGSFAMSPLMTRSLEKLHRVIDKEMKAIGGQKVTLPCLALGKDWKKSGRWGVMGAEMFKLQDRHEQDYCLAPTHEEAITKYVASYGMIYKNYLPIMLYQIGRKYRDEMRPKHGLLRCREFEMKDLYTFDIDLEHAKKTYETVTGAYEAILNRLELDYVRVAASSGAMGGSVSHEFHLVSDIGEDTLYKCSHCNKSFNQELIEEAEKLGRPFDCGLEDKNCDFTKLTAIEVCHAFILGTKYSNVFKAKYKDEFGHNHSMYMGCYGIGVTRLIAASLEILSQAKEARWPRVIAPYQILVTGSKVGDNRDKIDEKAKKLCSQFTRFHHLQDEVVLANERKQSVGKSILLARFMGIPHVVVVNEQSLGCGAKYEYIDVYNDKTSMMPEHELMGLFSGLDTVVL